MYSVYLSDINTMPQIGLSASTIASSFGKAISEDKGIEDYRPEDISLSLLRMISYNIGQASLVVKLFYLDTSLCTLVNMRFLC